MPVIPARATDEWHYLIGNSVDTMNGPGAMLFRSLLRHRKYRWASISVASAILVFALYFLLHNLKAVGVEEIKGALNGVPTQKLWLSALLTGISFLALGGYDVIAASIVAPRRTLLGRAWFVGAVANAISNTLGFHALTSTAVRYRLLTRSGLTSSQVAAVSALSWTALAFGFTSMLSLAMMLSPASSYWQQGGGLAMLGVLLLFVRWLGSGKSISLKGYSLSLPSGAVSLTQMILGALEMAAAIGALYVLMPASAATSFPAFSALYISAVLLGIASHAPGGVGVFEATILTLSHGQDRAGIFAALLLYRMIYNLCPFALAVLAFGIEEIRAALSSKAGSS